MATNSLIYDSDDVKIAKNAAGKSQTGIYLQGNRGKVEGNHVFDTDIFDGLVLFGDDNKAENNTITHSDEAAIFLLGDGNKVTGNKINEAPIGVWKFGGTGNVIEGNQFANTPVPVLDPPRLPRREAFPSRIRSAGSVSVGMTGGLGIRCDSVPLANRSPGGCAT